MEDEQPPVLESGETFPLRMRAQLSELKWRESSFLRAGKEQWPSLIFGLRGIYLVMIVYKYFVSAVGSLKVNLIESEVSMIKELFEHLGHAKPLVYPQI